MIKTFGVRSSAFGVKIKKKIEDKGKKEEKE